MNVEIEIAEAMRANGIMPPRYISFDGKLRRFGPKKSSWCVFFDGRVKAGAFGDWKNGVSEKFVESRSDITADERRRIKQDWQKASALRERERRQVREKVTNDCNMIWILAKASGLNLYLIDRGIRHSVSDYGLRQGIEPFGYYSPFGNDNESLVIPAVDTDGLIWSLQFIAPDGRKRFYPGGKLRGHFCPIALTENPKKILICEGIATALTLYEDSALPVIAAFNCGNLAPVAESIRWKYSNANLLICGDDDWTTEGNPGVTKAEEAAARCGGDWVLPDFTGLPRGPKDTDFNDLKRLKETA